MPLPLIASAIGSLASFGAAGLQARLNSEQQARNQERTIQANKEMAQYQWSKDLEMWNMGNKYNSPEAQMQRLKAAGLNPNMVYGSGSAAGQSAGQLPKFNAPTAEYSHQPPVDLPAMLSAFQNFRIQNAQIRNTEEQATAREFTNKSSGSLIGVMENDSFGNASMKAMPKWLWDAQNKVEREFGGAKAALEIGRTQKEFRTAIINKANAERNKAIAATRNLDIQNEYYAAQAISGILGKVMQSVKMAFRR